MKVQEEDLASDPFKLLAALPPAQRGPMGHWGIAVVPLTFADGNDGFVVLATRTNKAIGATGSGANLIDEGCG